MTLRSTHSKIRSFTGFSFLTCSYNLSSELVSLLNFIVNCSSLLNLFCFFSPVKKGSLTRYNFYPISHSIVGEIFERICLENNVFVCKEPWVNHVKLTNLAASLRLGSSSQFFHSDSDKFSHSNKNNFFEISKEKLDKLSVNRPCELKVKPPFDD